MAEATRIEDYITFLQKLTQEGCNYFLEGGQAVNFWAEYLSALCGEVVGLQQFQPYTSKDCDVWVAHGVLKKLEGFKEFKIQKGTSPLDGQLAILSFDGNPPKTVDLLSNVYGIDARQNQKLAERSLEVSGVKVIDPLNLFKSKCHCLTGLPQSGRQDEKHLRMLCLLVPAYIVTLLGSMQSLELGEREFIKELKLLKKITQESIVRRALQKLGVESASLFPVQELREVLGFEKLEKYVAREYGNAD